MHPEATLRGGLIASRPGQAATDVATATLDDARPGRGREPEGTGPVQAAVWPGPGRARGSRTIEAGTIRGPSDSSHPVLLDEPETASVTQVRQSVYTRSVADWKKKCDSDLGELFAVFPIREGTPSQLGESPRRKRSPGLVGLRRVPPRLTTPS